MRRPLIALLALYISNTTIQFNAAIGSFIRGHNSLAAHEGENTREPPPCDNNIPDLLDSFANEDPGEINRLRRILAIENPTCFDKYFGNFAHHFLKRLKKVKKHLNLHIPKSGGSSFCSIGRHSKYGPGISSDTNCWERSHFYPMWCLFHFGTRPKWESCKDMDASVPDFIMNENYLDYPLCMQQRLYSILIRDPVDRAISHELHLEALKDNGHHNMHKKIFDARLAMARMNYMTWALTADLVGDDKDRALEVPTKMHAQMAMDTLSRFDFLLELSVNLRCDAEILHFMGMGDQVKEPHKNTDAGVAESEKHPPEKMSIYTEWNDLDLEVYHYARRLMKADCDFYHKLLKSGWTNKRPSEIIM